ncbi:MAG: efflux RND transporter permease subunit [Microscillaceae bacterium]|nr:efflux RND transporter permease subunit [Microscillaceae bacterium]MDW8461392.1 efflux RND transporter permease subunit [Cytophagales bacterium]
MASLSELSIRRPVLAIVMSVSIVLFGYIGFRYLGVREYPNIDPPVVNVTVNYTGANADIVESQITEPLEEAINGIPGIRSITSVSRDGRSTITVEFELSVNIEEAANDVRDKVSRAVGNLPRDADPPIVAKADANSDPIMFFNIKSDQRNALELTDIVERVFKEKFQTVPGVSEVLIWGAQRYAMRIWIDPVKLAAYKLTPLDVQNTLNRENIELPSGSIEGNNTELTIRTIGRLSTPEDFNNMIIKEEGDRVVRLRDIGEAKLGPENLRTVMRRDGKRMVAVAIVAQAGANQVAIAERVYQMLEKIKKDLPPDIEVNLGFDISRYIKASITEVEETIVLAFILVVVIIFAFLRDWRTTIIPTIAIPISLIGTFFIMYVLDFSINVLTLLGIVLAIGLVVDDAIVVLENIYAKVEKGMHPMKASLEGSREIFFAVVSTTITLVTVFMPLLFLQGFTGRLFKEFGLVVAGSVAISAFVSLTLTPMMSSRMLKERQKQPWLYRITEPFFVWLSQSYEQMLTTFLRLRWIAFVLMLGLAYLTYTLLNILPTELAPMEDRSNFRIIATAPEGSTFDYMDNYMNELAEICMQNIPEREGVIAITAPGFGAASSVNTGFVRIILKDKKDRKRSQQAIVEDITQKISQTTAARNIIIQEPTIGNRRGGQPVQYVLQAMNLEKLKEALPKFMEKASSNPKFLFTDVDLKFNKPEVKIEIDREKARNLGVSALDIARTLQVALSGQRFGYFLMNGKQYQVIGQLKRENRSKIIDLKSLYIKNSKGELIQLDNLVTLKEQSTPPQLYRSERYVSATVSAMPAKGVSLGEALKEMDKIAKETLDETFSTTLAGQSRDFVESSSSLLFAFVLALVLIYLVLAAQFESFKDPLTIMITVPLALAGALISLWYFRQTINIFSQIGIIMLIGLVTKNGILIVEFANQRKAEGVPIRKAILEAAISRFRPILMTSFCTILGTLPIALAFGAGAESRVSMGIAIVGGMIFSTILTLFIIPAIYTYLTDSYKPKTEEKQLEIA